MEHTFIVSSWNTHLLSLVYTSTQCTRGVCFFLDEDITN